MRLLRFLSKTDLSYRGDFSVEKERSLDVRVVWNT